MVTFVSSRLVSAATFPGIVVHQSLSLLFCRLRRVPVSGVRFFRFDTPAGYVEHEVPEDFFSAWLIAIGPFIAGSLLCLAVCFPVLVPLDLSDQPDALDLLLAWIGISIGMHAFPSSPEAKQLWKGARIAAGGGDVLAILTFPLVLFVFVANILSPLWFDYMYGVTLGWGVPTLILKAMT